MELIDENGRIFGVVNVIDALAVLLVLAVVVAGIALVNPFASSEEVTRYATVDLGEQPAYVAGQVSPGDVMSPTNTPRNLTITDVYVTPAGEGNVSVVVRAEIDGVLRESDGSPGTAFTFAGNRIRQGGSLSIDTVDYTASGRILRLDDDGRSLETVRKRIRVSATVSPDIARTIEPGDAVTLDGREVAKITNVHRLPGENSTTRWVSVGVELDALQRSGDLSYSGVRLALDRQLTLNLSSYRLTGRIEAMDTDRVQTASMAVTVRTTVSGRIADAVAVGDEYRVAGTTVGTVRSIETYSAGDGDRSQVILGLDLATVRRDGSQFFGPTPLRLGATVPFETDAYRLSGTVINRGSITLPGERTTKTVVIKVANVDPEIADGIREGMTEGRGGETSARIVDKRVEPASVILTSESGEIFQRQHPRNQDVYLTVEVTVRETRTGLQFHSKTLQEGTEVTLDFGTISVSGNIIEIE